MATFTDAELGLAAAPVTPPAAPAISAAKHTFTDAELGLPPPEPSLLEKGISAAKGAATSAEAAVKSAVAPGPKTAAALKAAVPLAKSVIEKGVGLTTTNLSQLKGVTNEAIKTAAAAGDMVLGAPASVAGWMAGVGRAIGAAAATSNYDATFESLLDEHLPAIPIPGTKLSLPTEQLKAPLQYIYQHLTGNQPINMSLISNVIKSSSADIEASTGIPKALTEKLISGIMDFGGLKGLKEGGALVGKKLGDVSGAKPAPEVKSVPPGQTDPAGKPYDKAAMDAHQFLSDAVGVKAAPAPTMPALKKAGLLDASGNPMFGGVGKAQGGAIDPKLRDTLLTFTTGAGVGLGAGAALYKYLSNKYGDDKEKMQQDIERLKSMVPDQPGMAKPDTGIRRPPGLNDKPKNIIASLAPLAAALVGHIALHGDAISEAAFKDPKTGEIIPQGEAHSEELKTTRPDLEPGFLTNKGQFLDRAAAKEAAVKSGQLTSEQAAKTLPEGLHSEDLWGKIPGETKTPLSQLGKADPKLLAALTVGIAGATVAAATDPKHPYGLAALGFGLGVAGAHFTPPLWEAVRASSKNVTCSQQLADSLHALTGKAQWTQVQMLKFAQQIKQEAPDYAANAETLYHSLEDPSIHLTPRQQELMTKYVKPIMDMNATLRLALEKEGIKVSSDVDSYVHRIGKGHPSIFEQIARTSPQGRGLSAFASALKERKVFSLTDTTFGTKVYMVMDPKGNGFKVYQDGKVIDAGHATAKELAAGEITSKNGQWTKGPATTREIEANTPIRYHHDAVASAIGSLVELTKAYNNVKFLKDLKNSPDFEKFGTRDLGNAPKDWREVPQIPQLRDIKFAPRVANVLEDFAGAHGEMLGENVGKISRFLTGSMFWNPLPHIFNVLDHAVVQRGLVSGWANPAAYPRLVRTTMQAWKAVMNQTPEYARFVKEGAGTMYPSVLVSNFAAKVLKNLGTDVQMGSVAKAWGYANPKALVSAIYRQSRQTLWAANDIIMMQAYLEHEAMKTPNVIREVERHIPNYRIPDQVMGSRRISELLRSPVALAFGRYDYGRMRSYGSMVKDLVAKDSTLGDRATALDQIAMVGFMGLVVYPLLMDKVAKAITGNPNATAQRFGASTVPYLAYEYLHGDVEGSQVISSLFPMGMALKAGVELYTNRDLFTGKHLLESGHEIAPFIANQLSPLYTAGQIQRGKQSPEQFFEQSVGIKSPTQQQLNRRAAYRARARAEEERRAR